MNSTQPDYRVSKQFGWVYKVLREFETVLGVRMLEIEIRDSRDGHPITTWVRPDEVCAPQDVQRAERCFTELQKYA